MAEAGLVAMIGAVVFLSLLAGLFWCVLRAGYCIEPLPREVVAEARARLDTLAEEPDEPAESPAAEPRSEEPAAAACESGQPERAAGAPPRPAEPPPTPQTRLSRARRSKLRFAWELMPEGCEMSGAPRA